MATATSGRTWKRPTVFPSYRVKWAVYLAVGGLFVWSAFGLFWGQSVSRFVDGIGYGTALVSSMYPPETGSTELNRLFDALVETIAMAMIATVTGIAISIPVAFGAAENLVPRPVYWLNRTIISISRAVDALIVAIIAVAAVGFGPLAGIVAISFKTVGFFSKLLAEDLEDIEMGSMEAVSASGASRFQTIVYGVVPQIVPRFVGLTIYRWDINVRAAAIVGIVGAGGIGQVLLTAFSRYEYDYVASILLAIVAVVLVAEFASARIRRRVQ